MPVGAELINPNTGSIVAGNVLPLLALKSKQTLNVASVGAATASVSNPVASVVAFKSNKPASITESAIVSGSKTYTFRTVEANTLIEVFCFDITSNVIPTPLSMGFQTFSEDGTLLFDAIHGKYFRPVLKQRMSFAEGYNKTIVNVPPGRSYAVSVADTIYAWEYGEGGGTDYYPAFQVGGSVVGSTLTRLVSPGDYYGDSPGDVLVIDVTNF